MTDGIGNFSAQMHHCELACVLPDLGASGAVRERVQRFCVRNFSNEERLAFSRWAADRFATEVAVPRIAALYRAI
jgi:hypothetical protein